MKEGGLSLGQVADSLAMLDVICNQCGRRSGLNTARLVHEHGREMAMLALLDLLAGDYPRRASSSLLPGLRRTFPQLRALFRGQIPTARHEVLGGVPPKVVGEAET